MNTKHSGPSLMEKIDDKDKLYTDIQAAFYPQMDLSPAYVEVLIFENSKQRTAYGVFYLYSMLL